jgi:hypothetical protein
MTTTSNFQEDSFRSIERELAAEMSRNGEIFIEKAGGLFEARK